MKTHTHTVKRRLAMCLAVIFAASASSLVCAQPTDTYPTKPITWLVGYPPGGSVDVITRLVARKLESQLGQPVVVDNRPGATGAIALKAAAGAAADGYTLVTVPGPVITSTPQPQVGTELSPVAMLGKGATILVGPARADAPKDLKALLADASANPNKYSFATSGNGTGQHLMGELINVTAGTRMVHVPYKGGGQAVTDLLSGQVPLAVLGITPVQAHVKSGKLMAYGVSTGIRSTSLPQVPTLREAGLANFDASQWFVVAAPRGLAQEKITKLNAAIGQVLRDSEVVSGFEGLGIAAETATPQQVSAFVSSDLKRWAELVQKAKLPLE